MAEPSIYDLVVEELLNRHQIIKKELHDRFNKSKPFRQEPVDNKQLLVEYDEMTPEKKQWLRQQFGDEAVMPYFEKLEKLKQQYQKPSEEVQ